MFPLPVHISEIIKSNFDVFHRYAEDLKLLQTLSLNVKFDKISSIFTCLKWRNAKRKKKKNVKKRRRKKNYHEIAIHNSKVANCTVLFISYLYINLWSSYTGCYHICHTQVCLSVFTNWIWLNMYKIFVFAVTLKCICFIKPDENRKCVEQ